MDWLSCLLQWAIIILVRLRPPHSATASSPSTPDTSNFSLGSRRTSGSERLSDRSTMNSYRHQATRTARCVAHSDAWYTTEDG
ncbi:uncharacterized protein SCHCODRAFT_02163999 [Schizophyllum commune H4-8]|uniref:uncharacterized protein n=1 Tax=Schizophyllum commune (strain H4-8 / FGSC 9210) TaxID=578458 RepID=UPI002160A1BD|nr:uncharacterized protein SCHCODRAFT_02163999 [Schizophyllum commune H4-8]KAI5898391.1 hypothetical protein SCHCODRAFT_02163999 [Schizophyllum commune H4-8]